MTRTGLVLVIGCCAVVAAAITAVLENEDLFPASEAATPLATPSANTDGKRDRMAVAPGTTVPGGSRFDFDATGRFVDPLRQAYASDSPLLSPNLTYQAPLAVPPPGALQKLKPAKTPIQKNYSLMSDAQIAAIKARLKLTPQQETLWPAVEASLRKIAKTMHERRLASASPAIDPEGEELTELRTAATPLLAKLREDQKRDVRMLARMIGLEAVASEL